MSKSALIVFAIISVIGVAGGSWMLSDGACSGLDECIGIRNCAKSESCSAAFFSVLLGMGGIGVTVYEIKKVRTRANSPPENSSPYALNLIETI